MKKNSPKEESVHLVYKKLGETPLQAISRFKNENPAYKDTPITYAGRLDPMAEGLLLVLSGEETKNKESYLNLPKTYQFEILWGFKSDTLDCLGLVSKQDLVIPEIKDLKKEIKNSVGKFEQMYPVYSSRPVNGKSLFEWAREGRISEIDIPKHLVEVYKAKYISREKIIGENLFDKLASNISLVDGDFRQEEILSEWKKVLKGEKKTEYVLDKFEIEVSSGFYVRQFVSDLTLKLSTIGLTSHIVREKIGKYSI